MYYARGVKNHKGSICRGIHRHGWVVYEFEEISQTKFVVKFNMLFRKNYKLAMKLGLKVELLEWVRYALTGNWIDLENVTSCLRGSYSLRNRGCCPGADPDRIGSHNGLFGK